MVMYDGVSTSTFDDTFTKQVQALTDAGKAIYQIAAPAQVWNMFAVTTNQLLAARPDMFDGVVLVGGSHIDSMLGRQPDLRCGAAVGRREIVPAGNTAAIYTLSTGWINDFYTPGATPQDPQYGFYAGGQPADHHRRRRGESGCPPRRQPALRSATARGVGDRRSSASCSASRRPRRSTPEATVSARWSPRRVTNGVTGVRTGSATLDIPSGQRLRRPGRLVLPDPGRRHRRRPTASSGCSTASSASRTGTPTWRLAAGPGDQQHRRGAAASSGSTPRLPGLLLGGEAMRRPSQMFLGDPAGAEHQRQRQAGFEGAAAAEVHPHRALRRRQLRHRGRRAAPSTTAAATDLLGVVMFDGVGRRRLFAASLAKLDSLRHPGLPDRRASRRAGTPGDRPPS